jgi:predicted NAD/FAD-binding protein
LLNLHERPPWRTVLGGSREYVSRLVAAGRFRSLRATGATRIDRDDSGVTVHDTSGGRARFDEVVIATHADEALALLGAPGAVERSILGAFRYSDNTAYLHEDPSLMPRRRAAWSSWNVLQTDADTGALPLAVTYWMNRLQPLATTRDFFVTLNPPTTPHAARTHGRYHYTHPIFDTRTSYEQLNSIALQGRRRTWFCGSYLGAGFHEDALQSGLWVAERLGCVRPWNDSGVFTRLPPSYARLKAPRLALSA